MTKGVDLDSLSRWFREFAERDARGYSPLYEKVCLGVADDAEVLALAAGAHGPPYPNVLLAAVHYLLLGGADHPLRHFYPSVSQTSVRDDDPYPYFRRFCLEHQDAIRDLIVTRRVQTNEVGRCAYLLPAIEAVSQLSGRPPLAMIDVGASAGLALLWDRYGYVYDGHDRRGDASSPVQMRCEVRGDRRPPLPVEMPRVASRTGIDLNPVDVGDDDQVLWLQALIWPEHKDRADLFEAAVEIARLHPPSMVAGDALDLLPGVVEGAPEEATVCIFQNWIWAQLGATGMDRLRAVEEELGVKRDVYVIWSDGYQLGLRSFESGKKNERLLANIHAHGHWLEWVDDEG